MPTGSNRSASIRCCDISVRTATTADLPELSRLYRSLQEEMNALSGMWSLADGLAEPVEESLSDLVSDPDTLVYLGFLDDVAFGFTAVAIENVLPQADGMQVGSFRLIFVDHDAREVGLGEAIRDTAMDALAQLGITRFDAHVLPGHRLVKNFFESGGFSARSIVMHHDAERER